MNRSTLLLLILTWALSFTACSTLKVATQSDPNSDISSFKTYEFRMAEMINTRNRQTNELNLLIIKDAIRKELNERGYVASESPDMGIYLFISGTVETGTNPEKVYHMNPAGTWYSYEEKSWEVSKGNLVVELVNDQASQMIWQGKASAVTKETQEELEEQIHKAVEKMFEDFPAAK